MVRRSGLVSGVVPTRQAQAATGDWMLNPDGKSFTLRGRDSFRVIKMLQACAQDRTTAPASALDTTR